MEPKTSPEKQSDRSTRGKDTLRTQSSEHLSLPRVVSDIFLLSLIRRNIVRPPVIASFHQLSSNLGLVQIPNSMIVDKSFPTRVLRQEKISNFSYSHLGAQSQYFESF